MAFDGLTEKLSQAFKKLKSKGKLSETDVKSSMREIRLILLEADVNYKVAKDFSSKVLERAIGENVMESLTPAQMVIKIVKDELTDLMGRGQSRLNISSKSPSIIMICGLQGSGKTTHTAKLALMLKKQGHRPLMVACDIYRPAAVKQLQILGEKIGVYVFSKENCNPVDICKDAIKHAKDHGNDIVILDTAGRLHVDDKLMNELCEINKQVFPNEILLAIDSMTGQDAVNVAENFNNLLNITGIILTKLDGDTRGGAALSVNSVTGKPIKLIGNGEKLENIEQFHPDRMASRILGMGDVLSLIEDAQVNFDKNQAQNIAQKLENNSFDLNDLKNQFIQIRKMGPLKSIFSKLPGMDKQLKDIDLDDKIIDRMCAIILSMTEQERRKPSIINPSRKRRIASGSGMRVEDVNRLLRQFEQMKNVVKKLGVGRGKKRFPNFNFPNLMR